MAQWFFEPPLTASLSNSNYDEGKVGEKIRLLQLVDQQ